MNTPSRQIDLNNDKHIYLTPDEVDDIHCLTLYITFKPGDPFIQHLPGMCVLPSKDERQFFSNIDFNNKNDLLKAAAIVSKYTQGRWWSDWWLN